MTHRTLSPERLNAIGIVANFHLQSHKGRANGIKAVHLSAKTQMSERTLRSAIEALRKAGVAVVGTPETGYFLAQNADELNECCSFLSARAMNSLVIVARLKQLSMPELMGQIALDMNLTPAVIPA
jgi:predicted DNA-binding transcriptional regulator YafY